MEETVLNENGHYMSAIIEIPTPPELEIANETIHMRYIFIADDFGTIDKKIGELEAKYGNKAFIEGENSIQQVIKLKDD